MMASGEESIMFFTVKELTCKKKHTQLSIIKSLKPKVVSVIVDLAETYQVNYIAITCVL